MKKSTERILIVFICFVIYVFLFKVYLNQMHNTLLGNLKSIFTNDFLSIFTNDFLSVFLTSLVVYSIVSIPIFVGFGLLNRGKVVVKEIFRWKDFFYGFLLFLGLFVVFFICGTISVKHYEIFYQLLYTLAYFPSAFLLQLCATKFFFEELFENTNWGYLPIVLVISLVSSLPISELLYEINTSNRSGFDGFSYFLIFIFSFMDNFLKLAFFSWVYVELKKNIWLPVFLSLIFTRLFLVANYNALGAIIFVIMILGIVFGIVFYKKKNNIPFVVNRNNFWKKKQILIS